MKKVIILLIVSLIMLFGCNREQNIGNDLDIEKYIGKIWVVKDRDIQEESSYISFIISQLDNEQIEGYFDIDETIMPDIRIYTKVFKDEIYPVDINKWGTIDFVSRFREGSKHSVLFVYLTDKSGNIIYDFAYPNYFPTASYVHDFKFTDLNSDGLEDLILILSCGGDTRQARVYFQNSKKGFEENEVLFDKLNSEKDSYNKDVECVTNFIEKENF